MDVSSFRINGADGENRTPMSDKARWNLNPSEGLNQGQQGAVSGDNPHDSNAIESTVLTANSYNSGDISAAVTVALSGGFHALVDEADLDRVSRHKWSHHTNGINHYAVRVERGRRIYLHRLLMAADAGQIVDHIDGNGLNCCRHNMRFADTYQNAQNRTKPRTKNPFKGVDLRANGRYRAKIRHNQKTRHLGYFETPEDAALAYDSAAVDLFGAFAKVNFPSQIVQSGGLKARLSQGFGGAQ